jgi:hypothetical protein
LIEAASGAILREGVRRFGAHWIAPQEQVAESRKTT